jgi:hypothetical protein
MVMNDIVGNELRNGEGRMGCNDPPVEDPSNNTVNISTGLYNIGNVYSAYVGSTSIHVDGTPMTGNRVNVNNGAGSFNNHDIYGAICFRQKVKC